MSGGWADTDDDTCNPPEQARSLFVALVRNLLLSRAAAPEPTQQVSRCPTRRWLRSTSTSYAMSSTAIGTTRSGRAFSTIFSLVRPRITELVDLLGCQRIDAYVDIDRASRGESRPSCSPRGPCDRQKGPPSFYFLLSPSQSLAGVWPAQRHHLRDWLLPAQRTGSPQWGLASIFQGMSGELPG